MNEKKYTSKHVRELRNRWNGEQNRINEIITRIKANEEWLDLIDGSNNSYEKLKSIETCPKKFNGKDLRGINFEKDIQGEVIYIVGSNELSNCCLDYCIMPYVILEKVALEETSFRHSFFSENFTILNSTSQNIDISYSTFRGKLENVILTRPNIIGTNFVHAKLINVEFYKMTKELDSGVKIDLFSQEEWYGFLIRTVWCFFSLLGWLLGKEIVHRKWTRFGGDSLSSNIEKITADNHLKRYIQKENSRYYLESKHTILSVFYYVSSFYGRSVFRVVFWFVLTWLFWGWVYGGFQGSKILSNSFLSPVLCWEETISSDNQTITTCMEETKYQDGSLFLPFYLSAVTMTTLGYGDITPATHDMFGQIYVCIQVIMGYILLGLLIDAIVDKKN